MASLGAMCGSNRETQEFQMTTILPIVIFLIVIVALNKTMTGSFF